QSALAVQWQNIWPNLAFQTVSMNGPLWSIQVELFVAPLIPLMVLLSRRTPLAVDAIILAVLAATLKTWRHYFSENYPQLLFVAYLGCFYFGIVLHKLVGIGWLRQMFTFRPIAFFLLFFGAYAFGRTTAGGIDFTGYLIVALVVGAWLVAHGACD